MGKAPWGPAGRVPGTLFAGIADPLVLPPGLADSWGSAGCVRCFACRGRGALRAELAEPHGGPWDPWDPWGALGPSGEPGGPILGQSSLTGGFFNRGGRKRVQSRKNGKLKSVAAPPLRSEVYVRRQVVPGPYPCDPNFIDDMSGLVVLTVRV